MFFYFVVKQLFYYRYSLIIADGVQAGDRQTERNCGQEDLQLFFMAMAAAFGALAGISIGSSLHYMFWLLLALIFNIGSVQFLKDAYPWLEVEGEPISKVRTSWIWTNVFEGAVTGVAVILLFQKKGVAVFGGWGEEDVAKWVVYVAILFLGASLVRELSKRYWTSGRTPQPRASSSNS
jgi:hypothetical protein